MRAIQLQELDGIEALTDREVPRPEPERHELLVRVHAAGVNPIDWLICRGMLPHLLDDELPWTPGWDVSGVVESVGPDVTGFDPGDAVCGMARLPGAGGAFADYTTMTGENLTAKPDSLSHIEAAAIPMAGQTAFHALYEEGGLDSGQRVLVHAAAGGVGHMAVQFATNTGAHVIGTASGRNEAFLRELGIDEFVNYREQQFEDVLDSVDIVLDAVGGEVLERSVEVVQPGGVIVTLPEPPSDAMTRRCSNEHGVDIRFFDVITDSDPAVLRRTAAHVEAGVVTPHIGDTYPLSAVQDALDRSADGHVRGKLVITPDGLDETRRLQSDENG